MAVDGSGGGDGRSGQKPTDESLIDNFELRKGAEAKPRQPEETPDAQHEALAIEKQVANPNIHYGSQAEPEVFIDHAEDDAPAPESSQIPEIPTETTDKPTLTSGEPVPPKDYPGASIEESLARNPSSSGSPARRVTVPESEAPPFEASTTPETGIQAPEGRGDSSSSQGPQALPPQGGTSTTGGSVAPPVSGTNNAPQANNAAYSGPQEDSIAQSFAFSATDLDGDSLTYAIVTQPPEGSVTDNGDGTFSFSPGAGFQDLGIGQTRDVAFIYQANDGQGGSDTGTITITVAGSNDGPTAGNVSYGGPQEDGTVQSFSYGATDLDGDSLTYSITAPPTEGSITDNGDGTFSFDPGSDFQDLAVGQTRDVSFSYQVSDGQGGSDTATVTITVAGTNDAPITNDAAYTGLQEDGAAQSFAYGATDVDGDSLSYTITAQPSEGSVVDNGDGTFAFDPGSDFQDLGIGQTRDVSFSYQVSDGQGGSDTATVTIAVAGTNDAPIANDVTFTGPAEDGAAQSFAYGASDIDGNSLAYTITAQPSEGSVTDNGDGTFAFNPGSDFQDLGVGQTRDVTFTYQVSDGQGGTDTATATVTVSGTNDAPIANDATFTGPAEDGAAQSFAYGATDLDGDSLAYSITAQPSEGSVTDNGDGTFAFDPGTNFQDLGVGQTRDVTFTYQVSDGQGGTDSATATITVSGTNDAPVVQDDLFSGDEDTPITGNVLTNDSDVEGDTLTVTSAGTFATAAGGSVTIAADGSFTYTPVLNYNGSDSFTYTVTDGNGGAGTGTVTLDVPPVNDAPIANDFTFTGPAEDGAAQSFAYGATDVDGDSLAYSITAQPSEGSVTDNGDGTFAFDPGSDFQDLGVGQTRDVTFTYEVSDGQGGTDSATATVTVSGTNDAPVANDATFTGPAEDGAAQSFAYGASDVDGDSLAYSITAQPSEGSVVDNGDGTFSFNPGSDFQDLGAGQTRDVTFTYEVSDGQGGTDSATATVTVSGTNDAPVANDATFTGSAEDGAAQSFAYGATDVDGDALSYSITAQPSEGSVTDNGDGSFAFDPGSDFQDLGVGQTRDVTFTYEVSDGQGGTDTATATVTVSGTNDAPVANDATFTGPAEDGAAQSFAYGATDVDGDSLAYTITAQPSEGSVTDNGDGTFAFDPGADFQDLGVGQTRDVTFTYEVSDGQGGTDTATATVTVSGTNDAPVANDATFTGPQEDGATQSFAYGASDVDGDSLAYSITAQPSEGSVTDNGDGSFAFDPGSDFQDLGVGQTRDVTFTYEVSDGQGGTDTATATVTVSGTNDAPVANDATFTGPAEDGAAQSFAYGASDVDGDSLAYSITAQPSEGSVVDNGDGTFSFNPGSDFQDLGAGQTRDVTFTYEVSDGQGGTDTATATVTVSGTNDAPVANDATFTGPAEDGAAQSFAYGATDVDGDSLAYSITAQPSEGSVTDNGDGTFAFDPGSDFQDLGVGQTRDVTFTYEVSDGQGGTDSATATVTVSGTNDAPVANDATFTGPAEDGAAQSFAYGASDVDGDSLAYTITAQPSEGSVTDNGDGTFAFDPGADFQDLGVGQTRDVTFTYEVSDGQGGTDTATATVTVSGTNDAPVANDATFTGPQEDGAAQSFAYGATDVDGDSLAYTITAQPSEGSVTDNGDGSFAFDPGSDFQDLGVGQTRDVTFTYQVSDGQGGTDTATGTITVAGTNDAPVANDATFTGPAEDGAAQSFAYGATDVDGDSLAYSITAQPSEGSVTDNGDGTFAFDPGSDFQDLGVGQTRDVTFTYEVSDGQGGTDTATATVTVSGTNDAPVANDATFTGPQEDGATQSFAYGASDVDGDSLAYSITAQPSEGSVTDNGDGTFAFDPGSDFQDLGVGQTRDVTFTYEVSDGQGGTDTATGTITVAGTNDAPVANDATFTGPAEDGAAQSFVYGATDVDGDSLAYTITAQPSEGSVTDNGDGTFSFNPGSDFQDLGAGQTRDVTFTYEVSDGQGGTDTATGTITVAGTNDAPVAQNDGFSGAEDTLISGNVLVNDNDIDGDALTVTSAGTFASANGGSVTLAADGSFTYTPAPGFNGSDSFSYTVADGNGGTDNATVNLAIGAVNDPPVANDATFTGPQEDGAAQSFAYGATDVDGDSLAYTITAQPSEGSVTDNGDGSFAFDPGSDFQDLGVGQTRDVTFTYQVSDGQGGTDTATATVTVSGTNDAPVANDATFTGPAEDGAAQSFAYGATDVDGDSLAYSITAQPSEGSVTDNGDGSFAFDPGSDFQDLGVGQTRDVTFTYQVSDGQGGTDTATATVTVSGTNDAPVANDATFTGPAEDGAAQSFAYGASDVDGDSLAYSITAQPSEGSVVDNGDGTFSFNPGSDFQDLGAGQTRDVTFTYEVSDGQGGTDSATATVTVSGTNDAPVANDATFTGPAEDGAAQSFAYGASDVDGDSLAYTITAQPSEGAVVDNGDGTFAFDPGADFQDLGVGQTRDVTFTYQVSDGQGGTDTATATVTVSGTNDAPVANDATFTGPAEDGAAQSFAYGASDVDGDSLAYTITAQPSEGSVTDNGDGTFAFDPGSDFQDLGVGQTRDVTFTYEVSDGQGGTDTATGTITVAGTNDAPVANDATFTGPAEDGAAQSFVYGATDVDGDSLAYTITAQPSEGSVTDNGDGSFAFDPGAGFQDLGVGQTRDVTFTYEVSDGQGGTDTATATVTVSGTNDAPVANDATFTGPTEDGAAQSFAYGASDVDGDSLAYTITAQPSEGSVVDNGDGTFSFNPGSDFQDLGAGQTRDVTFTYQVSDGQGGTDTATATVTVSGTNDAPVANDATFTGPAEDGAAQSFAYGATDVDGDSLAYSITAQPSEGSVTDNGDGTFAFDPGSDFQDLGVGQTRDVTFTYQVSDGQGGTDTATATVTVSGTNDAPVANDATFTGPAEDGAAQSFAYGASDVDGDSLAYTITAQPSEGSVTDNGDGTFAFDPGSDFQDLGVGQTRDVTFTYEVSDGQGGTDTATGTITVAGTNDAPVANDATFTGPAEDGAAQSFVYGATDVDGDSLAYTITAQPSEGSVTDNGDGSFAFDPGAGFQDLGVGQTRDVTFTYEVSDGQGGTDTATATVTVSGTNDAPVANDATFTGPTEDGAAQSFAYGASDVDGDSLAYSITAQPSEGSVVDNGDGTFSFNPGSDFQDLGAGQTRDVTFTYEVSDGQGGTDTATATVTVSGTNDAPVANDATFTGPAEDGAAQSFAYGATDVDGDSLAYSITAQPSEGSVTDNGDGTFAFDPGSDFQDLGVGQTRDVTFTYEVSDGQGGTDSATATVTVSGTNDAPVANDATFTGPAEDGAAQSFAYGASDVDGDSLAYTITAQPSEGSVTDNGDGTFAFDPGADFQDLGVGQTRDVTFTYEVSDGQGGTDTATATVTVSGTNDAPVANDATFTGPQEDGAAQSFAYGATDVDGDSLAYSITAQPSEGSVTDNGDGSFAFDPGSDFQDLGVGQTRDVTFTYQVSDGQGGTDTATGTITVAGTNDAPVANDATFTGPAEDGAAQSFAYGATDVDGDSLAYSITAQPSEGSVTDNGDGTFAFDPGSDFQDLGVGQTRDVTFTYEVSDGQGGTDSATATVTVSGTNDAPVANDATFTGPAEDGAAQSFAYGASDVDGDSLAYTITAQPSEGAVVDNGDGTFAFDPGADFQDLGVGQTRDVTFTYQVSDGQGGTDTATATVTVSGTNDAPVANDATFTGPAEDGAAQSFAYGASDVDGDSLAYSITAQPSEGSVTDNGDGTFAFDPGSDFQDLGVGQTRDVTFTYEVSDGQGGTDTATGTITVAGTNDAPVANDATFTGPAEDGAAQSFAYGATDVDGDALSYTITAQPSEGSVVDNGDGTFAFGPGSDFQDLGVGQSRDVTFTYEVSDGQGGTDTATATVTVSGTNDAPVANDATFTGPTEDGAAQSFAYGASDVDGDSLAYTITAQPSEGSVVDNGDGTFSFNPGSDFQDLGAGQTRDVTFTYQVSDGQGGTDTATATVTVSGTNDAPVANDATFTGPAEDGAAQSFAYGATDVDGDSLAYTITAQPSEGSVTDNGDGTFAFDPGADFQDLSVGQTRDVTFTYEVSDGQGGTDTATGTITVAGTNDAPVANDATFTGPAEDGAAQSFAYGATDVDGDALSYTITAQPSEGAVVDNGDGTFAFDPGAGFQDLGVGETRNVSFTYEVIDGQGGTDTATATITVAGTNDAPVAGDLSYTLDEHPADGTSIGTVPASDTDSNDTVTFSITGGNADGAFAIDPATGAVTVADGSLIDFESSATRVLTVTADDGNGGTDTSTVTVNLNDINEASTISLTDATGDEDTAIALDIQVTDLEPGATHTVTISGVPSGAGLSAGTDNGDGSWTLSPGQLSGLTVTPPQDSDADFQLSVTTASDDGSTAVTAGPQLLDVTVDPVADTPNLSVTATASGTEDGTAALQLPQSILDLDSSPDVNVVISNVPAGSVLSAGTDNGDGTWTLGTGELTGLTITPPAGTTVDFQVDVAATGTVSENLIDADFDSGTNGFTYTDDTFRSTNAPAYADGTSGAGLGETGGGLSVDLGGIDNADIYGMSGGWQTTVNVDANSTGTLSFRYNMTLASDYESNEFGQVLVSVDGTLHGTGGNDYVAQINGDGNGGASQSTGWQTFTVDLGSLSPGAHTIVLGGYNNQKTFNNESIQIQFDNVQLTTEEAVTVNDTIDVSPDFADLNISSSLVDIDGSESLSIVISDVPTGATLSAGTDNGDGTWTLSEGDLPGLTLAPPSNFTGTFQLTATATATDGTDTADRVETIDVTITMPGVPAAIDSSLTTDEDTGHVFTLSDFGYSDIDGDPLATVEITAVPGDGTLLLNGSPVTAGQQIDASDITAGNLVYQPTADSDVDTSFTFRVSDGTTFSAAPATMAITIDAVADVPVLTVTDADGMTLESAANFETGGGTGFNSGPVDGWSAGAANEIEIWSEDDQPGDAFLGDEFIEINYQSGGTFSDAGLIERVVSTTDGEPYELTMQVSPRPGFESYADFEVRAVDVATGTVLKTWTIDADGTAVSELTWTGHTFRFEGTGADVRLEIEDTGAVHASGRGAFIDDIRFGESQGYTSQDVIDLSQHISAGLSDTDGSEALGTIDISGIPTGFSLESGGSAVAIVDGTVQVTPAQLANLNLSSPAGFDGELNLTVSTSSTEASNGDTAGASDTLTIPIVSNDQDFDALGSAGNDTINGTGSDETLYGGAGNDTIDAGGGDDTVYGGSGDDAISGGTGEDVLFGGTGNDTINGGGDADLIMGGMGDDVLNGDAGNDDLFGGRGNDQLSGGTGDDVLGGGAGDDTMLGGDGSDFFVFDRGDGTDQVEGGLGGGWTDTIHLEGVTGGPTTGGWTIQITSGTIDQTNPDSLVLSDDAEGVIVFDNNGGEINFEGIERVEW